jgi:AcrR family transcriptional regulator
VAARRERLAPDARRDQLLAFGRAHFGARGFAEGSLDALAREAGVSKALLYHYFGGRRGFFLATVEELGARLEATFSPPEDLPFAEKLRASLRGFVEVASAEAAMFRTLLRGGLGADPDLASIVERVRKSASRALARELGIVRPSRALRIALAGSVGFVESATLAWIDEGAKNPEAHVQAMERVVTAALLNAKEEP